VAVHGRRDRDEVVAALERRIASTAIAAEGDTLYLAGDRGDSGELVAEFSFTWVSRDHATGELGFIVHPAHQGQGYATEGGAALLRLAFEELGFHRVIGRMEARNEASARVMEKLGMRREPIPLENE
jgi:RimJ/RimL family protein N-acetyltransferase